MQELTSKIKPLLRDIKHPSRYIGEEFGAPKIDAAADQFNFCMVYPDVYDIGQSNQAVQILCNKANEVEGFAAQRSFLPEPQTIEKFKANGIPMFSLETLSPLCEFDAIGITVSHDLVATNICEVLDFAGIPIFAKDRNTPANIDPVPLIFGGGPMYCNPEPYHAFFDVITIGEGEVATIEALKLVRDLKAKDVSRQEILFELSKLEGIYVPSLYEIWPGDLWPAPKDPDSDLPNRIRRVIYKDFSTSKAFDGCIVPFAQIVHNRLNIEVLRGCARGCRFCQAGIMYRPVRERNVNNICDGVITGLEQTGHDEVSLTSLSTTDHSQIEEILGTLNRKLDGRGMRISIPSQRLDAFGINMARLVAGNKKGGLTFAIEAGSQRLRNVINKNVTLEDIDSATQFAFENGWNRAKLYFMIGLPTETDDDLLAIADMCEHVLEVARDSAGEKRRHGVNISVSCAIFVPKPQTSFEVYGQISIDEAMRRINLIRKNLHSKAISFSWHDPKTSMLEAVISRGSREVCDLIYEAWKSGAKFDAWDEFFNFDAWTSAADKLGMNLQEMACANLDEALPWGHIDFGIDEMFFKRERDKAKSETTTPDCTFDKCQNCGICQNLNVKNEIAGSR